MDLEIVSSQLRRIQTEIPAAGVLYAVKANPEPDVLNALHAAGAGFDVASAGEIEHCLSLGIPAGLLSFGHTVKSRADISYAYAVGVEEFALDSREELRKLAELAPGARVFVRLSCDGTGADWPLGMKFGCSPGRALELLWEAHSLGLSPQGVSFHVGSQQREPTRWREAIEVAAGVLLRAREAGLECARLNLGGGWPAATDERVLPMESYGEVVRAALAALPFTPEVLIEPGRFLVGDAGVVRTQVVGIQQREDGLRWVFLDVGLYNGLFEGWDAVARFRVSSDARGPLIPTVLAGPTCDSMDVLNQREPLLLPAGVVEGDVLTVACAGAYTASCSSVGFNGFAPLAVYCLGSTSAR